MKRLYFLSGVLILFAVTYLLFLPQVATAQAAINYPNNGDSGDVAIAGDGSNLEAPYSRFEVATRDPASNVTVRIKDICSPKTNGAAEAWIGLSRSGVKQNYGGDCEGDDIVFRGVDTVANAKYNGKLATATVTVHKIGSGHRPFIVNVDQGVVSYRPDAHYQDSNDVGDNYSAFGIWGRGSGDPGSLSLSFTFTPSCDFNESDSVWLKWKDADAGSTYQPNQPNSIKWVLSDITPGDSSSYTQGGQELGGPGVANIGSANVSFMIHAGHTYTWNWYGVSSDNALQVLVPFGENGAYYNLKCGGTNKEPTGQLGVSCDTNATNSMNYLFKGNDPDDDGESVSYKLISPGGSTIKSGKTSTAGTGGQMASSGVGTYKLQIQDKETLDWTQVDTSYLDKANCAPAGTPTNYGRCYQYRVDNDGTNDGWASRTIVAINGTPGVFDSVGFGNHYGTWTWNYFPSENPHANSAIDSSNGSVRIKWVMQEYRNHPIYHPPQPYTGKDGKTYYTAAYYTDNYTWDDISSGDETHYCYKATCEIVGVGTNPWGARPNDDSIRSGDNYTVTAKITNTSDEPPYILPENMWGYHLSLSGSSGEDGGPHNVGAALYQGQSAYVNIPASSNGNARNFGIGVYPDFWGWGGITGASSCYHTMHIYEHFTVDSFNASSNLSPDEENPNTFSYSTGLCVHASTPVRLSTSSNAYKDPYSGGRQGIDSNSGGDYGCGTIWSGSRGVSGVTAGDRFCTTLSASPTSGYVGPGGSTDQAETSGSADTGAVCKRVHDEPYAQVFGSDVFAGGGFGASCTTQTGTIKAFLNSVGSSSARPSGSGVQIGALAIGPITGFSSATLRDSSPFGSTGLSFSNSTNTSGGPSNAPNLGGNLGGKHCVSDYFASKPTLTADTTPTINANAGSNVTKLYKPPGGSGSTPGTLTITGGSISNSANEAIYVDGNVIINGDITYASSDWGTVDAIPSFRIVASGNIYISPSVKRLDGLYVAEPRDVTQPSNGGGTIYTCANGTTQYDTTGLYANCRVQLVVNGAFVSNKTFHDRTFSSRRYSYPGERLGTTVQACGNSGNSAFKNCSAEVFNFTPEMYLVRPDIPPASGPTTGRYDYVTSLSPVL